MHNIINPDIMLVNSTLITSSTPGAIPTIPTLNQRELASLVGRSAVALQSWLRRHNGAPVGSIALKYPGNPIPQYVSAYLQLLAGTHPAYSMQWVARGGRDLFARFPALFAPDKETAAAWRAEYGVTSADIVEAFGYRPDVNKAHSASAIHHDPVRWMLLRLMARDKRCGATVGRHGPERNPEAKPHPSVLVPSTAITTALTH